MTHRELWAVMAYRARATRRLRCQWKRAEHWKHRAKVEAARSWQLEIEVRQLRRRLAQLDAKGGP